MTLAVIVLAHQGPTQMALLLSALNHPAVRLYLHVDSGGDLASFRAELLAHGLGGVVLLPRFRSRWGGIEVVDATLAGLQRALVDGCDYCVVLSGQDLPLWSVEQIVSFFAETPDRSYLESFPLPTAHWRYEGRLRTDFYTYTVLGRRETCIPAGVEASFTWKGWALNSLLRLRGVFQPPRHFPTCATAFGGPQWLNLSRSATEFVLRFVEQHPEYRAYHEHTLLPDEIFFHSLLVGTDFADHHEIVNDALRFMIWAPGADHPRMLGPEDVSAMRASGKPFARKVDLERHPELLEQLATASVDAAPHGRAR